MQLRFLILFFFVFGWVKMLYAQEYPVQIYVKEAGTSLPLANVAINIYGSVSRTLQYTVTTDSTGKSQVTITETEKYILEASREHYVKRILNFKSEALNPGDTLHLDLEMEALKLKAESDYQNDNIELAPNKIEKSTISKNRLSVETDNDPLSKSGIIENEEGFSGYRIVVHFSRFPIPKDHVLYFSHSHVVEFETKSKNYLYMVEEYATLEEAIKGHEAYYKEEYPLSYVVGFEKGIRIK